MKGTKLRQKEKIIKHLNYIDTEIERLENKSIYDLLVEIENKAKTVNIEGHEIFNSFNYY